MTTKPLVWFEIGVQDVLRAKAFYESVFRIRLEPRDSNGVERWVFPGADTGTGRALVSKPDRPAGWNEALIYFDCLDCAVEACRAEQYGGHVQSGKTAIGKYGHLAYVIDTEGNMIGLHSMQ